MPHCTPHEPQFEGSVSRSTQTPLQRIWVGLGHEGITQAPLTHCSLRAQVLLQAPQLAVSNWVLVHTPLQLTWPGMGQGIGWHVPRRHCEFAAQRMPQPPQFRLSVDGSTQKPEQFARGGLQTPAHMPLRHAAPGTH